MQRFRLFGFFVLVTGIFSACQWFQRPPESTPEPQIQQQPAPAQEPPGFSARVISIHDGDTISVINDTKQQIKIRLATIDAPEYNQRFGRESRKNLSDLVFKKEVRVIPQYLDQYGRTIAIVMVGDLDVNAEQIREGFAWHYKQHQRDQSEENRRFYAEAEDAARNQKVGLWGDADPQPPWDYRKEEKNNKFNNQKPVRFNESSAADRREY